jgi:NADPH2:quinone reductase
MQAMVVTEYGSPAVLEKRDVPTPEPGPHDLLIEVKAAATNPVDCKIRQGYIPTGRTFPFILGYDVAGVVRSVGAEVTGFNEGDEVYAAPSLVRDGANAEYVLVDARTAAPKPATVDFATAAALPLVTLTAWEALFSHAHLHHGETVLIHGGAGGVGHVAMQLAKDQRCRVITTAGRDESIALCKQYGADDIINYREENVAERVKALTDDAGCPVVFETVGGDNLTTSIQCTAVHGRLVSILGAPQDAPVSDLFVKNASLHFEFMGAATMFGVGLAQQGEILRTAAEYVDAGKLTPHISARYTLDDLAAAHQQQETGHTLGKLVIEME